MTQNVSGQVEQPRRRVFVVAVEHALPGLGGIRGSRVVGATTMGRAVDSTVGGSRVGR